VSTDTWLDLPEDTHFGLHNLPYGVFDRPDVPSEPPRAGIAIGEHLLDLAPVAEALGRPEFSATLAHRSLNPLLALGRPRWTELRELITDWLTDRADRHLVEPHLIPREQIRLHLPFAPADYVDFYASEHHATTLGSLLRPGGAALLPNWKHLPVGYHGRAGTVVASGTPIVRPSGQRRPDPEQPPVFGPTTRLDLEAEVGFVVGGGPTVLGSSVPVADFREHVFGALLVNDWSARDIQGWEGQPLGPHLGKSFATSVGSWVVPLDALDAARVPPPPRDVPLLPYLRDDAEPWGLDIALEVRLNGHRISEPPFAEMYWTAPQQLAHMTVNGASLRPGDLFASGTVSGPGPYQRGSLIELTMGGQNPLKLPDGTERRFLEDGDEVRIGGSAPGPEGSRIGFGEVTGRVMLTGSD
jgi:fumarylacetoacetase